MKLVMFHKRNMSIPETESEPAYSEKEKQLYNTRTANSQNPMSHIHMHYTFKPAKIPNKSELFTINSMPQLPDTTSNLLLAKKAAFRNS
jgi:hypothetical protein